MLKRAAARFGARLLGTMPGGLACPADRPIHGSIRVLASSPMAKMPYLEGSYPPRKSRSECREAPGALLRTRGCE